MLVSIINTTLFISMCQWLWLLLMYIRRCHAPDLKINVWHRVPLVQTAACILQSVLCSGDTGVDRMFVVRSTLNNNEHDTNVSVDVDNGLTLVVCHSMPQKPGKTIKCMRTRCGPTKIKYAQPQRARFWPCTLHTLGRHTVVISIHAIHAIHAIRNQIPHNICHLNEIWNIYTNKIVCASNVARSEGKIRTNENVAVRWCCATLEANTNLRGVREHCEHCCQATRSEPNSQSQPHVRCPSAMYTSQSVDKRTGYTAMRRMGLYWKIYTEILKRYLCQESWFMRLAVWHALTAKRASFYVIAFECNGWILSNQHHV